MITMIMCRSICSMFVVDDRDNDNEGDEGGSGGNISRW